MACTRLDELSTFAHRARRNCRGGHMSWLQWETQKR
jgi:hypothetical protein